MTEIEQAAMYLRSGGYDLDNDLVAGILRQADMVGRLRAQRPLIHNGRKNNRKVK